MKLSILTAVILFQSSMALFGQNLECENFKNGYFKILMDESVETSYIIRNENMQAESVKGNPSISEFHIEWIDACTYTITPTEKTRSELIRIPENAVLTVYILETKENSYIQKTTANFTDYEYISEMIKIDASEYRNHIKEISKINSDKEEVDKK